MVLIDISEVFSFINQDIRGCKLIIIHRILDIFVSNYTRKTDKLARGFREMQGVTANVAPIFFCINATQNDR